MKIRFAKTTIAIVLLVLSLPAYSQEKFSFSKRFKECEDKWVMFAPDKDGKYTLGFIYIDPMAGLTLQYESDFMLDATDKMVREKSLDTLNARIKIRLEPNKGAVAFVPVARFKELGISETPDWLHIYSSYTDTAARLQRWGYYYNHFDMAEKALEYLEKGYEKYPDYKGMAVELAYAYNHLGQYPKAIPVLEKAIKAKPDDGYLYKELSYAFVKTDNLPKAEEAALNGIKYYNDKGMKAEMAYNLAYQYYTKKDKANFSKWAKESLKYAEKGGQVEKYLGLMEEKLKEN